MKLKHVNSRSTLKPDQAGLSQKDIFNSFSEGGHYSSYRGEATSGQATFVKYFYVYILESLQQAEHYHVGFTKNLSSRLCKHNSKQVKHTAKFTPWKIRVAIAFTDESQAREFEKYLKTGSGRAFAKRHF